MRHLLVTLFLLTSFLGFGQSVSAPDPIVFTPSTNGQDASGFVLSGFSSTATLLTSISLVTYPTGTTFYLTTTTGLTAASGFTLTGNKTRLVVTGTMENINIALNSLKVNTGATKGEVKLSVAATVNPTGYYYNGVNGHFYKPVTATADRTTYTNARARSLLSTFKGQTGYLVTITSASEDAFIFANVPATNVWFAATDEVIDGTWVIDAGPEKGTVMKTSNGQTAGNIQGVYNNWAGGEPNGYNHGEDYAVAKWNGATTWNDLNNNWANPYVIEYGTWSNPDDQTFTDFYTNSVSNSNGDILRVQFNFDFGNNVDETKFATKMFTTSDNVNYTQATTAGYKSLNGLGKVDMSADMDTVKSSTGLYKATTTGGQAEWCVIYDYDLTNHRYRVGIDSREFIGSSITPSQISILQLFDLYYGNAEFVSYDPNGWAEYYINTNVEFNFDQSTYSTYIRSGGWYRALKAEFAFSEYLAYKQHDLLFQSYNETQLGALYGQIVTVSDVYLAFKELSNGGIFGNQTGNEFGYGIQYDNADVNDDGYFNETDTYLLLQHLTGTGTNPLVAANVLPYMMKLIPQDTYNNIGKSNWNTFPSFQRAKYPITFNPTTLNTYNVSVTWKGDVNLSHSAIPSGINATNSINNQLSQIKSMSVTTNSIEDVEADIMMEKVGDSIAATINLNANGNQIGATQFDVYFDNSILEYSSTQFTNTTSTNFAKNNNSYISLGSLNTSGGSISNIGYKVVFKPKTTITNLLGMISVKSVETIATNMNKLNVKVL
jgi:hypothetical protein